MEIISNLLFEMAPQVHFVAFGLLILAGFNLPVSEDIVFIVSASIAATIIPENKYLIFTGCFLGAYFSDLIAYLIGRYGLHKLLKFNFFKKKIPETRIKKIETFFSKYGLKTLFFGRFIPFGVRNILFITAGLIKMKLVKFLLVDLSALFLTSLLLFNLGYSFGKNYQDIFPYLNKYKLLVGGIFLIMIFSFFLIKKRKNYLKKRSKK